MNVDKLQQLDREQAAEQYRLYREHRGAQTPEDREIMRAYREISKGNMIIRALASITAAGVGDDGRPKLAIMRADQKECRLRIENDRVKFTAPRVGRERYDSAAASLNFDVPMPGVKARWNGGTVTDAKAMVPLIPVHLRPKHSLTGYCILFEAEWSPMPPVDPYLLKHLSGDLWLVLAAWALTDVERAVMAHRVVA